MSDELALDILFYLAIVFSVPLLFISIMAVGKHVADLQYQIAAKLNGIRWIQSWIGLRTHFNRVLFAAVFLIVSVIGLFDVDLTIRMWVGRSLWLLLLLTYFASSILDWKAEQKQLRILMKFEDINNIPTMRLAIHKLNSRLTYYYGLTEFISKSEEQTKEIELVQDEIKTIIKGIQIDIHSMDPSYKIPIIEGGNANPQN